MPQTNSTTTKRVFQKTPFRILASLLVIEGVMIGQVLSRPGTAKETAGANAAQDKKDEDCANLTNPIQQRDCWLRKVKAGETNLQGANLSGADLRGLDLSGANLFKANLSRTNLTKADLKYADLTGADLRGATLTDADLKSVYLRDTKTDATTKIGPVKPFVPPPHQISVYRAGLVVWFLASRRTQPPTEAQQTAVKKLSDALEKVRTNALKFDDNGNLSFSDDDRSQSTVINCIRYVYSAFGIEVEKLAGYTVLDICITSTKAMVNIGLNETYYDRDRVRKFIEPLQDLIEGSTSKGLDGKVVDLGLDDPSDHRMPLWWSDADLEKKCGRTAPPQN